MNLSTRNSIDRCRRPSRDRKSTGAAKWASYLSLRDIKRATKVILQNVRDSTLYSFCRSNKPLQHVRRVVFVCKGNICRSTFAEYWMKSVTRGMPLIIESCGLDAHARTPSPAEAITTARMLGVDLEGHLAKGVEGCDIANADLILAMEFWQYKKLVVLFPNQRENIRLLREFAPFPERLLCNISDPYGQSQTEFRKCFKQIERSVANINTRTQK